MSIFQQQISQLHWIFRSSASQKKEMFVAAEFMVRHAHALALSLSLYLYVYVHDGLKIV